MKKRTVKIIEFLSKLVFAVWVIVMISLMQHLSEYVG
jgi:hypothetical protein